MAARKVEPVDEIYVLSSCWNDLKQLPKDAASRVITYLDRRVRDYHMLPPAEDEETGF